MKAINPGDDIATIYIKLSGKLFIVKGSGPFVCNGDKVKYFARFQPCFLQVLNLGSLIQLDGTFYVL